VTRVIHFNSKNEALNSRIINNFHMIQFLYKKEGYSFSGFGLVCVSIWRRPGFRSRPSSVLAIISCSTNWQALKKVVKDLRIRKRWSSRISIKAGRQERSLALEQIPCSALVPTQNCNRTHSHSLNEEYTPPMSRDTLLGGEFMQLRSETTQISKVFHFWLN